MMAPGVPTECVERVWKLVVLDGPHPSPGYKCNVQALRSGTNWSLGVGNQEDLHCGCIPRECIQAVSCKQCGTPAPVTERSIYLAYLETIALAEHFIYIENQYFISDTCEEDSTGFEVHNKIAEALAKKVISKMKAKETFRLTLVLPNHPDGSMAQAPVYVVAYWMLKTLKQSKNSLMQQIQDVADELGLDIDEYISVVCLRNFSVLGKGRDETGEECDRVTAEQIYVHAKIMIVDDRYVICGSANINDRSTTGVRDSEMAFLFSPCEDGMIDSTMNGTPCKVTKYAHDLRMHLWAEHLGMEGHGLHISAEDKARIKDPVLPEVFMGIWQFLAKSNAKVYKEAFPYMSNNDIKTPEEFLSLREKDEGRWRAGRSTRSLEAFTQMIKGHLCQFPTEFLSEQTLPLTAQVLSNSTVPL